MIAVNTQKRLAGDARVVFDVGAERGRYTRRYLEMFPRATVYAFEPAPVAYGALADLAKDEPRLKVIPAVVLDRAGETTFKIASADVLSSILDFQPGWTEHKTVTEIQVPAITLDDFCKQEGIEAVDVLKVDVQGAELWALKGATRLLTNGVKVILCELNYQSRYVGQCWHFSVCEFLAGYGYQLHALYLTYQDERLLRADGVFAR